MADSRDFCSTPASPQLSVKHAVDEAKKKIDLVMNPLAGPASGAAYSNAGISSSNQITTYETTYKVINLDPNNPYDIYYTDKNPDIWQRNRDSDSIYIRQNIQKIHDNIVVPVRNRIKFMFGDSATANVEYCFMSPAALMTNNYPRSHLFSKARAVLLTIEGTRASMVFDDIVYWMKDDSDTELVKPQYGLMKLCNINQDTQRIYFTDVFTDEELKQDELLLTNYSNFYYTEANDIKMTPDIGTSTKIFPSYQPDNNVEDVYTKKDDLEEELEKVNKRLTSEGISKNPEAVKSLMIKKMELESELDTNKVQLNTDLNETDYKIKLYEKINSKVQSDESEYILNELKEKKDRFPDLKTETNISSVISKYDNLEDILTAELLISNSDTNYNVIRDYFLLKKMVALYGLKEIINNTKFTPNTDEVNEQLTYQLSIYEAERRKRYDHVYKEKLKLPHTNSDYIQITESELNMDTIQKPTEASIIQEMQDEFNTIKQKVNDAYSQKNPALIEFLDLSKYDISSIFKNMSNSQLIELEWNESKRFPLLKEITTQLGIETTMNPEFPKLNFKNEINKNPSINPLFVYAANDKSDYPLVLEKYLEFLQRNDTTAEDITDKINLSKVVNKKLEESGLNMIILPNNNTMEYATYCISYLKTLIESYTEMNLIDKLNEVNQKLAEYQAYFDANDYTKFNFEDIRADIYQCKEAEYYATKYQFLEDYKKDSIPLDDKIIFEICYRIVSLYEEMQGYGWFKDLTEIGKKSIEYQAISTTIQRYVNDGKVNGQIVIIPNSIIQASNELINICNNYIQQLNEKLNSYIDARIFLNFDNKKKYIDKSKATDSNISSNKINIDLFRIHREFAKQYAIISLLDYSSECVSLNEQILNLKYIEKDSKDNAYKLLLKENRLRLKRTFEYLVLNDVRKKQKNYEEEAKIALETNRLGRYEQIVNEILPEIGRMADFKENLIETIQIADDYETVRNEEVERLKYLSQKYITDLWIYYRSITYKTTSDFKNLRGVFNNDSLTKTELYLLYLEELIKSLEAANNAVLIPEIDALNKEIAYIKNENNEKKERKKEIFINITNRKKAIEDEYNRRTNDKIYLHTITQIVEIENRLKYQFKNFMIIENLPSVGLQYKFPFKLYKEFVDAYKSVIDIDGSVTIEFPELIDAYRMYAKNFYLYEKRFNKFSLLLNEKWKKINYTLFTDDATKPIYVPKLIIDPKKYEMKIMTHAKYDFEEMVSYALKNIVGFMEYELIPTVSVYNNDNLSSVINITIRRNIDFMDDLKLFLINLYELSVEEINENIKIKEI